MSDFTVNITGHIDVSVTHNLLCGSGGSAPWTPAALSPILWLKADAGVTQVAGAVSNWASQEGLGYNFAQATGANKPAYSATGFNTSYPGLTFTAASPSFLFMNNFILNCPTGIFSIYVVMNYTAAKQNFGGILSFRFNTAAVDFNAPNFVLETVTPTARQVELFINIQRGNTSNAAGPADGVGAAFGWVADGVNVTEYVNNAALGTATAFSSAVGGATGSELAIGTRPWNGNTPSFDGTIAEIIITDTALGVTDRGLLQTYIAAKWGITAWTPASLGAALIGWYKADAGVYSDAGVTPATNGQTVRQWNDQSGTGNNLSQATSARRPTYNTNVLNSLPGISFVSANTQWIANQAIALGGTTASVFFVVKGNNSPAGGRLCSFVATGAAADYDNTPSAIFLYTDSGVHVQAYRTGILSGGTIVDGAFTQLGSIYNGVNNTAYINGTGQTPVANTDTFAATGALSFGAYVDTPPGSTTGGAPIDGTICEIIVTNSALSGADRALLAAYLTAKWGI